MSQEFCHLFSEFRSINWTLVSLQAHPPAGFGSTSVINLHVHPVAASNHRLQPHSCTKTILSFQLFHQQNEIFSCLKDTYFGVGRNLKVLCFAQLLLSTFAESASRFFGNSWCLHNRGFKCILQSRLHNFNYENTLLIIPNAPPNVNKAVEKKKGIKTGL